MGESHENIGHILHQNQLEKKRILNNILNEYNKGFAMLCPDT